eukprot:SAG22_NODE_11321_length_490_cov_1.053708_1_plen_66_part_10
MYNNVLNRPPDPEGLGHYSEDGVSTAQICDELLRSSEFRDKHDARRLALAQAELWNELMGAYPIEQ